MMTNLQLAQTVVAALTEANPAYLLALANSHRLPDFLAKRIAAFKLQFVREMDGKPKQAELTVMEGLLPMLTHFPMASQRPTLTPPQQAMVEAQMEQYAEASYQMSPVPSPASSSDPISV